MIDKEKALRKWSPIIESLDVDMTDKNKVEFMSIYAEYVTMLTPIITGNLAHYRNITNNIEETSLPLQMKILSKINFKDKLIIVNGLNNNNKIVFSDPHPREKYIFSVEKLEIDIKTVRKDKINALNNNIRIDPFERLNKLVSNIIINDINDRLSEGHILYIDERLIDKFSNNNAPYKTSIEFITNYDII